MSDKIYNWVLGNVKTHYLAKEKEFLAEIFLCGHDYQDKSETPVKAEHKLAKRLSEMKYIHDNFRLN